MENRKKGLLPKNIIEKFTTHAKCAFEKSAVFACEESSDSQRGEILPRHILAALAQEPGGLGNNILKAHRLEEQDLADPRHVQPPDASGSIKLSPEAKSIVKRAVFAASLHSHRYIGTEHLLYGTVLWALKTERRHRAKTLDSASDLSEKFRAKAPKLKRHLEEILASINRFPDIASMFELTDEPFRQMLALQQRNLTQDGSGESPSHREVEAETKKIAEIVPQNANIPELLVELPALASQHGMALESISFNVKGGDGAQGTPAAGSGDEAGKLFREMQTDISLKGTYDTLKLLLRALERDLRLMDVTFVSFSGLSEEGDTTAFDISAKLYYGLQI